MALPNVTVPAVPAKSATYAVVFGQVVSAVSAYHSLLVVFQVPVPPDAVPLPVGSQV